MKNRNGQDNGGLSSVRSDGENREREGVGGENLSWQSYSVVSGCCDGKDVVVVASDYNLHSR